MLFTDIVQIRALITKHFIRSATTRLVQTGQKAILVVAAVAVLMSPAYGQNYISPGMDAFYPFYIHGEQSDTAEVRLKHNFGGSIQEEAIPVKDKGKAPPADYDNDSNVEFIVRDQGRGDVFAYQLKDGGQSLVQEFQPAFTPKPNVAFVTDKDGDVYPDLVFQGSNNGNIRLYDENDGSRIWDGTNGGVDVDSKIGGKLMGAGDTDQDGYPEIMHTDGSAQIKRLHYRPGDPEFSGGPTDEVWASVSTKSNTYSDTADFDNDGKIGVGVANSNSGNFEAYDSDGFTDMGNPTGGLKGVPTAALQHDSDQNIELVGAGNSNNLVVAQVDDTPAKADGTAPKDFFGVYSALPPRVNEPNASDGVLGKEVVVNFTVSDSSGFTDILNRSVRAEFTSPAGITYNVSNKSSLRQTQEISSRFFTDQNAGGRFVPADGTSKMFQVNFTVPENAEPGDWTVTVFAQDEKRTGSQNSTTLTVEKAIVEKTEAQTLSFSKNRNRGTSAARQAGYLFSITSQLSKDFVNRRAESLSISLQNPNRRTASVSGLSSVSVGLSFAPGSTKTSFGSVVSALNYVSSASRSSEPLRALATSLGLSQTTAANSSAPRLFSVAITTENALTPGAKRFREAILGFSIAPSQTGRATIRQTLADSLAIASSEDRDLAGTRTLLSVFTASPTEGNNLSLGRETSVKALLTDPAVRGLEVSTTVPQVLSVSESVLSSSEFRLTESLSLGISGSRSGPAQLDRSVEESLDVLSSTGLFSGEQRLVLLALGIGTESDGSALAPRSDSLEVGLQQQTDRSSALSRGVTQVVEVSLGLGDLIDFLEEFFFEDDQESGDGSGSGSGGDDGGGGGGDGGGSGGSSSSGGGGFSGLEPGGGDQENQSQEPGSDTEDSEEDTREGVEEIGSELELESGGSETELSTFLSADAGESVAIDVETPDSADAARVSAVSFSATSQATNASFRVDDVQTVGNKVSTSMRVLEATNISTPVDAENASVTYSVEKDILRRNGASSSDLAVFKWRPDSSNRRLETDVASNQSTYTVEAFSPEGFSVFVLSVERDSEPVPVSDPPSGGFRLPSLPTSTLSLGLVLGSVYLLRRPLSRYLFTLDLRFGYAAEWLKSKWLSLKGRVALRRESDEVGRELDDLEDVRSLRNRREILEFRKNRMEREIEEDKRVEREIRRQVVVAMDRIDEWKERLG
jgi:PGF-pre-PGF domain-containing protein